MTSKNRNLKLKIRLRNKMRMEKIEELREGKIKNKRDLRQSTDCKINLNWKIWKLSMNPSKLKNMHRKIKTKSIIKINQKTKINQNKKVKRRENSAIIVREDKNLNPMRKNKKIMRNKSAIKREEIKRKTLRNKKKILKRKIKILKNRLKKSPRSKVVSLVIASVSQALKVTILLI
jgi:hypothetical protein